MRLHLLPLAIVALGVAGCSTSYKPVKPFPSEKHHRMTEKTYRRSIDRTSAVQIFNNTSDLVSKPFRDLGEVSGDDCQSTHQDSPANINTARKRMQLKAANLEANAILIHQCQIIHGVSGCVRQAICQGSALKINQ